MYSYGPKTSGLPIPTGTQIATSRRPPSGLSDLTLVFTSAVPINQVNKTSHENDTHKISRLRSVTYPNYLVLPFRYVDCRHCRFYHPHHAHATHATSLGNK